LEVFCVSNTTYEKFSRKGNTEMVLASGIPELRRFCHTITAGAQFLEAKHFLRSNLSSLLSSVELWASSFKPRPQIEEAVQDELILDNLKIKSLVVSACFHLLLRHTDKGRLTARSTSRKKSSKILSGRYFLNI